MENETGTIEKWKRDYWLANNMLFITGGIAYATDAQGNTVVWGTEEEARAKYPITDVAKRRSRK